jgi:hypothetical protein
MMTKAMSMQMLYMMLISCLVLLHRLTCTIQGPCGTKLLDIPF